MNLGSASDKVVSSLSSSSMYTEFTRSRTAYVVAVQIFLAHSLAEMADVKFRQAVSLSSLTILRSSLVKSALIGPNLHARVY